MLDPKLTSVLPRRILAFALDFGIVGLLSALVARSQFETFPADSSTWTAAQLNRVRDLAGPLSRQQDIGDTKYVIPGGGLLLVVAIASVLALIIFVLLPASTGWTPGKRLLGLRTVDLGGDEPTMSQYLTRAVVGLIDVLPGFIPGLLGFALAGTSTHRQRLGDRLAGTLVIDAKKAPASGVPAAGRRRSIDIEQRLDNAHEPREHQREANEPTTSESAAPPPTTERSASCEPGPEPTTAPAADGMPELATDDELQPGRHADPSLQFDSAVDRLAETIDIPEPIDTTMPVINVEFDASGPPTRADRSNLFSASASPSDSFAGSATRAFSAGLGAELGERKLPPAPMHRLDPAEWDRPRAEPAPVWRPADDSTSPMGESIDSAQTESVITDDDPAPSTESSLDSPDSPDAERGREQEPQTEPTTEKTTDLDPVWNDQWQAWLFWDHKRERWLRHDVEKDRWVPLS